MSDGVDEPRDGAGFEPETPARRTACMARAAACYSPTRISTEEMARRR